MISSYDVCFIMKAADLPQKMEGCRLCAGLLNTALPYADITTGFNKWPCLLAFLVEYLMNHVFSYFLREMFNLKSTKQHSYLSSLIFRQALVDSCDLPLALLIIQAMRMGKLSRDWMKSGRCFRRRHQGVCP